MEYKRTCAICGREFLARTPIGKYCCVECRAQGTIAVAAEWRKRNPHYHSEYMRRYRRIAEAVRAAGPDREKEIQEYLDSNPR